MYGGERQLRIAQAYPAPPGVRQEPFLRTTRHSGEELQVELDERIRSLDADMAALVRVVLASPVGENAPVVAQGGASPGTGGHFTSGEHLRVYERFCAWPAARQRHGACRHGLLAHSLRVGVIAEHLSAAYRSGGLPHDHHLVAAACLLHDVGKIYTLPAIAEAPLPASAAVCDHITHSVLMIATAATTLETSISPSRLQRLLHAVLAHHGRKEWGAPVEPQAVEAWLVHLADLAESRLWQWSTEECQ